MIEPEAAPREAVGDMQGSRAAPVARLVFAVLFGLLALGPARAQAVEEWFQRSPQAAPYATIRGEAEALARGAAAVGVPDRLLAQRLEEGAQKAVPADRLAAALRSEAALLESAAATLAKRALLPEDRDLAAEVLGQASLLIRAGIDEDELGAACDAALARPKKYAGAAISRALSALYTVVSIRSRVPLRESDGRRLAVALARSGLRTEDFPALVPVVVRYGASGLDPSEVVSIAVGLLGKGGSVESVGRELGGKGHSPQRDDAGPDRRQNGRSQRADGLFEKKAAP